MPEIYDDSGAENNVRCVEIAHCRLTLTSYLQLGGRVNWPLPSQKNTREENHTRTRQSHVLELLTVGRSWRKKAMCVRSACVTLALYFPARCFYRVGVLLLRRALVKISTRRTNTARHPHHEPRIAKVRSTVFEGIFEFRLLFTPSLDSAQRCSDANFIYKGLGKRAMMNRV